MTKVTYGNLNIAVDTHSLVCECQSITCTRKRRDEIMKTNKLGVCHTSLAPPLLLHLNTVYTRGLINMVVAAAEN